MRKFLRNKLGAISIALIATLIYGCTQKVPLQAGSAPIGSRPPIGDQKKARRISVPVVVEAKVPALMPMASTAAHELISADIPINKKIYEYPLQLILESSMQDVLYDVFEKSDISSLPRISIILTAPSAVLRARRDRASFALQVEASIRKEGIIIANKTLGSTSESGFDKRTTPEAVWTASYQIADQLLAWLEVQPWIKEMRTPAPALPPRPEKRPLFVSGIDFGAQWDSFPRKRWAVVIGIADYRYAGKGGLSKLEYADKDAQEFYNFLISDKGRFDPASVMLLTNQKATLENIRYALFEFLKQPLREDFVLIYFSGHGAPDPDRQDNYYLLAYDTNPTRLAASGLPMWQFGDLLGKNVESERILILADACHSSRVGRDTNPKDIRIVPTNRVNESLSKSVLTPTGSKRKREGRATLAASRQGQISHESHKWGGGHGVFTYFLLKALSGEADKNRDGKVTLKELADYIEVSVREHTKSAQWPSASGRFDAALPLSFVR